MRSDESQGEGTASDESGTPPTDDALSERSAPTGRTALAVSVMLALSSVLGLFRDLTLARLFGASAETDAFLVAWTIPETVSVLLLEGAMSYLLVPVFVRELSRRNTVARVVRATLVPLLGLLVVLTVAVIVAAPVLIDLLAPGLVERQLAIDCFRIAGATVLFMGMAGYLMAALRAHHRFLTPASTYVAYNVGILAAMYLLHSRFGVISAALGLAVGSALMVLIQIPAFLRLTSLRGLQLTVGPRILVAASAYIPIAAYSAGRQMQVFVERIVGSTLGQGAISHMNYASKVAQMASLLALTAAAIAFPSLARMAASDPDALRRRVELEFRRLVLLIAPAIAFLVVFAEPSVRMLFEHGAFQAGDTAQTSAVLRVYSLGLLGQVMVSLGSYVCFSSRRHSWDAAIAAAAGLVVTIALDVSLAPVLGVVALAVGNAAGITVSAVVLWVAIRRRTVRLRAGVLGRLFLLAAPVAALSAGAAWMACRLLPLNTFAEVVLGGTLTLVLFLVTTAALQVSESRDLLRTLGGRKSRTTEEREVEPR